MMRRFEPNEQAEWLILGRLVEKIDRLASQPFSIVHFLVANLMKVGSLPSPSIPRIEQIGRCRPAYAPFAEARHAIAQLPQQGDESLRQRVLRQRRLKIRHPMMP